MPLSPDEHRTLSTMAAEISEIHAEIPRIIAEMIQLRAKSVTHDDRLDRHDFRIGRVERHIGIESARARIGTSMAPSRPEDMGLTASDSGIHYLTKDVQSILEKARTQDAMRLGAEEALEEERLKAEREKAKTDRLLKLLGLGFGILLSAATVVSYLAGHFRP